MRSAVGVRGCGVGIVVVVWIVECAISGSDPGGGADDRVVVAVVVPLAARTAL